MKVHKDLNNLPHFRNAVITIGSFDGVHRGHKKILKRLKDLALATSGESVVITFHPHPRQIVYPKDDTLKLITTAEEKVDLLSESGIDHLVIIPFTFEFSQLSADEYIQRFLIQRFQPKYIVIGYDHRFGLNRLGDINYLKWYEETYSYKVVEIEKQVIEEVEISSSKIRRAIDRGNVAVASKLLGQFFTLSGKVVKGEQIGTKIGFPTANIEIDNKVKLIPPDGIYASYITVDGRDYKGMLYIGHRPTLKQSGKRRIEVHIFNFNQIIYDSFIKIKLVEYIRPDENLPGLEALKVRLEDDKTRSERILDKADSRVANWVNLKKPSVAIVILNYNGRNFLEKHLPSVLSTNYSNFKVYVADNASKDDSVAFVEKHYPEVGIIQLNQNHGFAKGYNLALEELEPDYFVLLNSDVDTPEHWLDPLVEIMEKDKLIAAAQPKIRALNEQEHFEYAGAAGGWIDFLGYPFCRGRIFSTVEKDLGQYDQETEIFWATGACMMVRAPLFKGFGGFDDEFYAHLEEIDLCWRFKRAGYKIMFCPKTTVWHLGGGTLSYHSPFKTYLNFRNSYYTLLKNEGVIKLAFLLPIRVAMDTVAAISFLAKGNWLHAQAVIGAFLTLFLALVTFIKKRIELEKLLDRLSILPQQNRQGIYPKSIVFHYFILGQKTFKRL
jgi:hypothetical protein